MSFDWLAFLDDRNIPYATSGPKVMRGNVVTHCPWCAGETLNDHMSISLEGRGWNCWRRPRKHGGVAATRLIQALLGCSWQQAAAIAGQSKTLPSGFLEAVMTHMNPPEQQARPSSLEMPDEFKPIKAFTSAKPYLNYLRKRGFWPTEIYKLIGNYDIRYCTRGPYAGRIVFPVKFEGRLCTWTARTIKTREELRYRTLSPNAEKAAAEGYPPAVAAVNQYLLWFDKLAKADADTLIVTEGPFDALKVDVLGRKYGIRATCLFTNNPTKNQIELLAGLYRKFRRRFIMLDQGTLGSMYQLQSRLKALNFKPLILPSRFKDPGEIDEKTLLRLTE